MNERIREFKEQATRTAMWIGDPDAGELDAEKFAELIVRECAMLVEGFILEQEVALDDYQEYEASAVLKEHFGVN
jgi:hypothetical protein